MHKQYWTILRERLSVWT